MEICVTPALLASIRKVEVHYDDAKSEAIGVVYLWSKFVYFPRVMIECL